MASSPFVLGSPNTASLRWPQYSRPPPLCQASIEFPGDTTGRCRVRAFVPLGSNFESFQHRKRETGIEKLSFEDIISQLKQEDLIKQRTANIALLWIPRRMTIMTVTLCKSRNSVAKTLGTKSEQSLEESEQSLVISEQSLVISEQSLVNSDRSLTIGYRSWVTRERSLVISD